MDERCKICKQLCSEVDGFVTYNCFEEEDGWVCNRCQQRAEMAQDECIERQIDDLIAKEHGGKL